MPRAETYWIGLDDRESQHGFRWRDGDYASYTSWAPGFPTYQNRVNCAVVSGGLLYKWKDVDCNEGHLFICEKQHLSE